MSQTSAITGSARLKCMAGRGMFPHETGILIRGVDQFYESILDSELVHPTGISTATGEDAPALIEVEVIKVNGAQLLVELPRQVVSGGRRIWVPRTEVES